MPDTRNLTVVFDSASDLAGVALYEEARLLSEATWRTHQNHSRELLPTLEWLLQRSTRTKAEIGSIIVCTGPGSYAGMRVGISTAKALAYGLEATLVGIGRLAADAEPIASVREGRVVAIHAAGRAELAWAAYQRDETGALLESVSPRLAPFEALVTEIEPGDIVCADLASLQPAAREALSGAGRLIETPVPRLSALARLGSARLQAGDLDDPDSLSPLYLRAPAIGPQS